jgi:hypothetical protein
VQVTEDGITIRWPSAIVTVESDGSVGYCIKDGALFRPGCSEIIDESTFAAAMRELMQAIN